MPQITMDDKVFKALRAKLAHAKDAHVKIGVLESKGGGGSPDGSSVSLAELAAIHEFGAPKAGIPARSFLRKTFTDEEGREALSRFLTRTGRQLIADKLDVKTALDQLGAWAVAQIKKRIKEHIPPPNKPATIKAKGSSTPLVDTGQLINAITWEVKE